MVRIWLVVLTFVVGVLAGARTADAQVFKPRGKASSTTKTAAPAKKPPAEAAPAKKPAAKKPAARKGDAPNRVAAKPKKSRPAARADADDPDEPVEATDAEDAPAKPKAGKARAARAAQSAKPKPHDEETADLGDDEVIITDDDD